jgi:hypothetical protein
MGVHSGHPGRLITTPSRRPEHSPRTPRGTVASGTWSGAGSRASPRRAGSRRRSHERGRATDHPARRLGGFGLGDAAREATRPLLLLVISLCFVGEHRRTRRVTPAWWGWQAAWRVFQRRRRQARRQIPAWAMPDGDAGVRRSSQAASTIIRPRRPRRGLVSTRMRTSCLSAFRKRMSTVGAARRTPRQPRTQRPRTSGSGSSPSRSARWA